MTTFEKTLLVLNNDLFKYFFGGLMGFFSSIIGYIVSHTLSIRKEKAIKIENELGRLKGAVSEFIDLLIYSNREGIESHYLWVTYQLAVIQNRFLEDNLDTKTADLFEKQREHSGREKEFLLKSIEAKRELINCITVVGRLTKSPTDNLVKKVIELEHKHSLSEEAKEISKQCSFAKEEIDSISLEKIRDRLGRAASLYCVAVEKLPETETKLMDEFDEIMKSINMII